MGNSECCKIDVTGDFHISGESGTSAYERSGELRSMDYACRIRCTTVALNREKEGLAV